MIHLPSGDQLTERDGKWITFLSKRKDQDEHTQIYKMRVDGGEAVALTHHKNSISSYQWSPDGKSIKGVSVACRIRSLLSGVQTRFQMLKSFSKG